MSPFSQKPQYIVEKVGGKTTIYSIGADEGKIQIGKCRQNQRKI